tara:strand:+ start:64 stop:267 length:204 start_codon:yes stop_codon:yes gene_type:complete
METRLSFQNPYQITKPVSSLQTKPPTLLNHSIGQGLFLIERIARALQLSIEIDKSHGIFTLKIQSIT